VSRFPKLLTGLFKDFRNSYNTGVDAVEKDIDKALSDSKSALSKSTTAESAATGAKTIAELVREEFDRIVAEAGSNNPEVVQAREGEVNLNSRLTKLSTTVAQKATKADVANHKNIYYSKLFPSIVDGINGDVWFMLPKEMQLYTNGLENVPWVTGYIYNDEGIQSKNAGYLYLYAGAADGQCTESYVTDVSKDLTNIKTLKVEWENTGAADVTYNNSIFSVKTPANKTKATFQVEQRLTGNFAKTITSLDVTSLTGLYHINVSALDSRSSVVTPSEIKVYRVWGEE
jgi:hypothetical protein